MSSIRSIAFLAIASGIASVAKAQSGTGTTTRYWDCCMPSCGWSGKADVSAPVGVCDVKNNPLTVGSSTQNGCNGGDAYMCADQSPWAVSDTLAYGFAATHIAGESESDWCCSCYELTFTSTSLATSGKKMIVQATNTGGDLNSNQFDLAIPGGGVGIFNGCTTEWGAPSSGWGAQYGGISSNTCSTFPTALQPGCDFRFGWFEGADNPSVSFKKVTCPAALTAKTGCVRAGETPTGSSSVGSEAATSAATSAASSAASSPSSVASSAASSPAAYSSAAQASSSAAASSPATYSSAAAVSSAASSLAGYSAAPVSSSEAAPVSTLSSASSSSVVTSQPGAYSSASSTSATGFATSASVASSPSSSTAAAAASTSASSSDAQCDVHYEYVYDL